METLSEKNSKFRILSLDGGGSWAIIQALTLGNFFGKNTPGRQILKHFDLVCANSGGSLVLAALIADFTPEYIESLFTGSMLNEIFSPLSLFETLTFNKTLGIGPKYSAKRKLNGLKKALGSQLLPDLVNSDKNPANWYISDVPKKIGLPNLQILIVNFNYRKNRATFYRSNTKSYADSGYCAFLKQSGYDPLNSTLPRPDFPGYHEATLGEIIHGASNAPVNFFDKPAEYMLKGNTYFDEFWDGAVGGYNNPVLAGVIEAVVNQVPSEKIKVLSIGTGNTELELRNGKTIAVAQEMYYVGSKKSSLFSDIPKLSKSILNDPPDAASFHAYCLLDNNIFRENTSFFRFNPLIKPVVDAQGVCAPPAGLTPDDFKRLADMDMDATDPNDILLIKKLYRSWEANGAFNQPVRNSSHPQAVIGYSDFTSARTEFFRKF